MSDSLSAVIFASVDTFSFSEERKYTRYSAAFVSAVTGSDCRNSRETNLLVTLEIGVKSVRPAVFVSTWALSIFTVTRGMMSSWGEEPPWT